MLKFATIKDPLPIACCLCGAGLLFMAWPLSFLLGWSDRNIAAQCLSILGLALLVIGLPRWRALQPILTRISECTQWQERIPSLLFICGAFILFLGAAITLSWVCFDFHPGYPDSTAQYVHGKFVAAGYIFGITGHPLHEFFPVWMMVHANSWYSQYPPLHQMLLGLGHSFNAPWIINPLEGALTLVLTYAIARRTYGENTGRLAALLLGLSPFVMIMSSEFMNHASALLFTTLLIYTYGKWQTTNHRYWALVTGLSSGCIFLTRPLTAIGVSAPFIVHALYCLAKNRQTNRVPCMMAAGGGMVCVLFQLLYNFETTGEWFTYAYTRYHENSLASAMGYNQSVSVSGTFAKMRDEWYWLNIGLFEWSLPCLLFALLACLTTGKNLTTKLLLGIVVSQTLMDMCNQFQSGIFGPRYLYEISTALVILTAVGIAQFRTLLSLPLGATSLIIILVCATGLVHRAPGKIRQYSHFMDSHPSFIRSMYKQAHAPALIFLGRGNTTDPDDSFRWTAWTNPPNPDAPVIFARDLGDSKNRALIAYYPTRQAYTETSGKLTPVTDTPFIAPPLPAP